MPLTELPIADGFYVSRSPVQSGQRCINFYVAPTQVSGLSSAALFGTPGAQELASSGVIAQENRGAQEKEGVPFYVNGDGLYRLNRSVVNGSEVFDLERLGTVEGSGRVSLADNGTQLVVQVPGGKGYVFDETLIPNFQEITDPDFRANGNPQLVEYIDGYFVFTTDTKRYIVSALNDALSYNALDFGSAEADPDDIVSLVVFRNQLFILGTETIEVFQTTTPAPAFGSPFSRVEGFVIPIGCFAKFTAVTAPKTFVFIGGSKDETPSVYQFTGSDVVPISTDAVDEVLQQFTEEEINEAFAWSYSQSGARFIGFTLPTTSLVYDLTSGLWHERRSQITDQDGTRSVRWRANSLVTAYNRILIGDSQDGRVGSINLGFYDEYGTSIIREVSTRPFSNQSKPFFVPSIELTLESGTGNSSVPEPVVSMSRSLDGKTFKDNITRRVGRVGEYNHRAIWRRNGRAARFEVFRFTMSDAVKYVVIKLEANIIGGQ